MGRLPPALSGPGCTGPPCQKVTKYWRQQKNSRPPKFHRFSPTFSSQYLCSEVSWKMVKAKDAHYNCPISGFLHLTFIWRPSRRWYAGFGNCSNWRWWRGGGLSAVPPAPDLTGRTRGEGGNATMHAAPAPFWALDLPTTSSFCLFPLLISLLITAKLDGCL